MSISLNSDAPLHLFSDLAPCNSLPLDGKKSGSAELLVSVPQSALIDEPEICVNAHAGRGSNGASMSRNDHPWLDQFVGREMDLARLIDDFKDTCAENEPRFIALVAESGVGKTRLVQQFYRSLRRTQDPHAYWPPDFPGDCVSLRLDPDYTDHGSADVRGLAAIPFLWWPVRFANPSQRNDSNILSCGILASAATLLPHLEHVRARQVLSAERAQAIDLFVDVVLEFAPLIAEQALPGLGLSKSVWQKRRESKRLREEKARIAATIASKGAFHHQQEIDLEARVLAGLDVLVASGSATRDRGSLPVVLVLDDLHWVDPRSESLLERVFKRATEKHWPLLVVATSWPQPWDNSVGDVDRPLAQLRTFLQGAWSVTERRLSRLSNPGSMIDRALPGLTHSQRQLLIDRMGGDLYALHLWLQDLRSRDRLFVGRDTGAALTSAGEQVLLDLKFPREDAIRAQFSRFDAGIKEVLGWAACQGFTFINRLVSSVGGRLNRDEGPSRTRPAAALKKAEDPLHFIERTSESTSRFSDPAHYAVVTSDLEDAPDDARDVRHATLAEMEAWIDDGRADELDWAELAQFLDIAKYVLSQCGPDFPRSSSLALKVRVLGDLLGARSARGAPQLTGERLDDLLNGFEALASLPLLTRARWVAALTERRLTFRSDARSIVVRLRSIAFSLADEAIAGVVADGDVRSVDALRLCVDSAVSLTYALFNIWHLLPSENEDDEDDMASHSASIDRLEHSFRAETLPRLSTMLRQVEQLSNPIGRLATISMLYAITNMAEAGSTEMDESQRSMAARLVSLPADEICDEPALKLLFEGPLTRALFEWRFSGSLHDHCRAVSLQFSRALECTDIALIGAYRLTVLACATKIASEWEDYHDDDAQGGADRAYVLSLELIRRGMAQTVMDWMSIQDRVYAAMELRSGRPVPADYLDRGWRGAERTVNDIFQVGTTLTAHETQHLTGACLRAVCRHFQHEEGPGAFAEFVARATSIVGPKVPHAVELARYTWATSAISQSDDSQSIRCSWYTSALRAITGVSVEYLVLRNDRERDDKIREQASSAARSAAERAALLGAALDGLLDVLAEDGLRDPETVPKAAGTASINVILTNSDVDLSHFPGASEAKASWMKAFGQLVQEGDGSLRPEGIASFVAETVRLRSTLPPGL